MPVNEKFDLEYNSLRDEMIISEYGRNVQKLVDYAKTLEDKEFRQEFVEEIINLMNIMIPANRSLTDHQQKMWNHLFKIAKFDLDVKVPEGIVIHQDSAQTLKADLTYPTATYKFRHYGAYIQGLIKKARAMEDGEKKDGLSESIASYMKLAYQTWNREHYVNDNVIKQDLEELSGGELTFEDDYSIENLVSIRQLKSTQQKNNAKSKKHKGKRKNNRKN